jgi:hypothetical protein
MYIKGVELIEASLSSLAYNSQYNSILEVSHVRPFL